MKRLFINLLFLGILIISLIWQVTIAPVWGLVFFNFVILFGLVLSRISISYLIWWVILAGLWLDLMTPGIAGIYLTSLVVALIIWPYVFGLISDEVSSGHLVLKIFGIVVIYELMIRVLASLSKNSFFRLDLDLLILILFEIFTVSVVYLILSMSLFKQSVSSHRFEIRK